MILDTLITRGWIISIFTTKRSGIIQWQASVKTTGNAYNIVYGQTLMEVEHKLKPYLAQSPPKSYFVEDYESRPKQPALGTPVNLGALL